tara:strand:+ start:1401 stop:2006 length:606 start_codon:yes stop_codon:yes gene_type:complete
MRPIQHLLSAQDYHVTNLDYPSRQLPIEALAELLAQVVEQEHDSDLPLFLVGYSMGGVLWRYVMQHYRPQGVEAVLQIGSPNHGSEIADRMAPYAWYRALFGPAGQQLTTAALPALFEGEHIDYPLTGIAGTLTFPPFDGWIGQPNDSKVPVSSTRVEGMQDHVCVPSCHTWMPSNRQVHHQLQHFLAHHAFDHSSGMASA